LQSDIINVLKDTVIYGLGKAAEQLTKFILLPLYTTYLTPSDYGILGLISLFTGLLGHVLGLGTATSIFRYYNYNVDQSERSKSYYTSITLVSLWSAIIYVVIVFTAEKISIVLFDTSNFKVHVLIGSFISILVTVYNIPMFILRAERKTKKFIASNILKLILNVICGIILVVYLDKGVLGALSASLISSSIFCFIIVLNVSRNINFSVSKDIFFELINYGAPLIITGLGLVILNTSDRYFLKEFSTLEIVGIYSVGYTIASSVNLIINSFQSAWPKFMYDYSDNADKGKFYGRVYTYYILIMSIVWLVLCLFSKDIVMLMTNNRFWDSYKIIPIISLAHIIVGSGSITSSGIYTQDKTKYELILMPITVMVGLITNIFFIYRYQIIGAAIATLISFIFQFIIYAWMSTKFIKINFQYFKILSIIIIIGASYLLSSLIIINNYLFSIILKILIIIIALFILLSSKRLFNKEYLYIDKMVFNE